MKLSKSLIAGMGILLVGVTPLLQAAPGPDDQHGQPQQQQQQGHSEQHGQQGGQQQKQNNGRPPQDFGPVRQTIQSNHADFGRGNPLPANVHVQKGHPLPKGYGKRLDSRALAHMPQYKGYEWRRLGNDVVLISVANGVVYEILSGVLN